jgi:tetratricopeptide (TPR) repeat protein
MWLNHGRHATLRFPDEPALALAHGIALETRGLVNMMNEDYPVWIPKAGVEKAMASGVPALPPNARIDAESALALLKQRTNPVPAAEKSLHLWNVAALMRTAAAGTESGPEGRMRLGYTFLRLAQTEGALVELQRAEKSATTPFVRYMARYFGGVAFERLRRRSDAVLAYRGALEAVPRAQSATIALSSILFQQGDRDEAADLALRALAPPLADDPIKYYKGGEAPAQWKVRIAALRKVLR